MSASAATSPERLRFNRDLLFPGGQGAAGLEVPSAGDREIVAALARNDPFPGRDIVLGTVELKADGGHDFAFGGDARVNFKGAGGAFAGLGLYRDPAVRGFHRARSAARSGGRPALPGCPVGV
jgi:hypothetical protein